MGVSISVYLEIFHDGCWQFDGRMVPLAERDYDLDVSDAVPEPILYTIGKELAAVLTGHPKDIRSAEPYVPVVPPRGLPLDLSTALEANLRRHEGESGFYANWFTAREALDFDWNQTMRRVAMVDPQVAHLFDGDRQGFPLAEWPPGVRISYAVWMKDGVTVEWTETYAEIAREFHDDVLPRVREAGPPNDVRVIVAAYW